MGQTASAERQFIDSVVKLPSKQTWRSAETGAVLSEFASMLMRYHESESAFGMLEKREIIKASNAVLDLLRKLVAAPADGSRPAEADLSLKDVLFTLYNCFRFTFVAKKLFSTSLDVLHTVLRGNMRQASLCLCLIMTGLAAADEHTKPQLCSQMDTVGLHQCLVDVLTFCAAHAPTGPSDEVDWTCHTVLAYLNWVLQTMKVGADTTAARVQCNLLQQQDALFEFTSHPLLVINTEASRLLCNLLVAESPADCRTIQEAALPYGVPLWQLIRCVSLTLKLRQVPVPCDAQTDDEEVDEDEKLPRDSLEYPMLCENIPATPEGLVSPPIICPSLEEALSVAEECLILLCMGSASTSQVVLRALPDAMTLFLVQKPKKASPRGAVHTRQDRIAQFQEKLSSSGNWAHLIMSLKDDAFSPRLIWNENTLVHLYQSLSSVNAELTHARRLKYCAWKSESFEVSYPMYRELLCVRGYFLPALARELESSISSYLSDPVKMTWSVHDHLHIEKDETNKTLCMRLLRLLLSRYSNLLANSLPIGFLTQLLKDATESLKNITLSEHPSNIPSVQWLGECVHLLKERLVNAERQDVLDFVYVDGLHAILDLLSNYVCVLALKATVDRRISTIHPSRSAVDTNSSDGDEDEDDELECAAEGRLPSKLLNSTKHTVFVSCAELLHHLIAVSADAARQLADPSHFERLMKALWLLGPHGPLPPIGQPWAASQIVLAIQRVLHVSPQLLSEIDANKLLSILVAISIEKSGIGMLVPAHAALLYELRSLAVDPDAAVRPDASIGSSAGKRMSTKVMMKRQSVHSIQELLHLRTIFPIQLISLATSMKADGFAVIFNADVTSSDIMWNAEMRRHCVEGLIAILRPWCEQFSPVSEEKPGGEPPKRVHYPLLDEQPQVAGVLLRPFLTAQRNSFVMPFDVPFFAKDLFRTIRQWNRVDAASPHPESRRAQDSASLHESFQNAPTEECAALLELAVCQLLKNFSLPEELWSNDGMTTVCHAVQASLGRMPQPGAQSTEDGEDAAWHWYAVAAGACVLLRSLSAKLTLDDSVVKTQVSMFTQNLREFRRSQQGFAQVFEMASEVLTPALRSCAAVLDAYTSDQVEQVIFACDLFMTASASFICAVLRRCVATRDGVETLESSAGAASHAANSMEVKNVFRVMQETSILRELMKLCDSKISLLCPRGVYSVVVALRRLFRISLDHAAETKQMLLDGGLLMLVLDTVVSLVLNDENNRNCFSPRRETAAAEKPELERSQSYLKTDLEEDAIDLQCVQACSDVENLLQKFVLDSATAKRHVRDKSIWPDFRPMLVRECILLLQEFAQGTRPAEEDHASAVKQPSPKTTPDTVEGVASAVLSQLLTPPIAHLLVDDPRTFVDVIASEHVRRPVAYWDSSMLQTLQQVIEEEMHRIHSAFGLDSWPVWTAQELLVREGYKANYPQVADEALVDNLYVASLTDPANFTDLGGRPIGEFVHSLQASIQSSQRILKHLNAARNPAANSVMTTLSLKERVLALILQKHPECDWRGGTYHDTDYTSA